MTSKMEIIPAGVREFEGFLKIFLSVLIHSSWFLDLLKVFNSCPPSKVERERNEIFPHPCWAFVWIKVAIKCERVKQHQKRTYGTGG